MADELEEKLRTLPTRRMRAREGLMEYEVRMAREAAIAALEWAAGQCGPGSSLDQTLRFKIAKLKGEK